MKNNLRTLRWERDLSQMQLSILSGVNRSTISQIETLEITPSVAIALRLARALGVTVEKIFKLS